MSFGKPALGLSEKSSPPIPHAVINSLTLSPLVHPAVRVSLLLILNKINQTCVEYKPVDYKQAESDLLFLLDEDYTDKMFRFILTKLIELIRCGGGCDVKVRTNLITQVTCNLNLLEFLRDITIGIQQYFVKKIIGSMPQLFEDISLQRNEVGEGCLAHEFKVGLLEIQPLKLYGSAVKELYVYLGTLDVFSRKKIRAIFRSWIDVVGQTEGRGQHKFQFYCFVMLRFLFELTKACKELQPEQALSLASAQEIIEQWQVLNLDETSLERAQCQFNRLMALMGYSKFSIVAFYIKFIINGAKNHNQAAQVLNLCRWSCLRYLVEGQHTKEGKITGAHHVFSTLLQAYQEELKPLQAQITKFSEEITEGLSVLNQLFGADAVVFLSQLNQKLNAFQADRASKMSSDSSMFEYSQAMNNLLNELTKKKNKGQALRTEINYYVSMNSPPLCFYEFLPKRPELSAIILFCHSPE